MNRILIALIAFLTLAIAPVRADQVSSLAAQALTQSDRLPLPLQRVRPALIQFYGKNQAPSYWTGPGRMTSFLNRVTNAALDGLNPSDYALESLTQLRDAAASGDASAAVKAELYFSAFYIAYASDLRIGRIAPQRVDPHLYRNRKTIDVVRVLSDMAKQPDPGKSLSNYEPRNAHYQALKKMMRVYTLVARENTWPVVPVTNTNVNPGGSDKRIPAIRALLSFTGDFGGDVTSSTVYESALVESVRLFQSRHGLEAKGVLGKQTILAMNVTPQDRIQQIMVNMERWRWMPDQMGNDHFLVNIAAYQLLRYSQGNVVEMMDVVAGAVATQTPEFSDEMEYVEFNPFWTVPYNIAVGEMLPKLRANPNAYAADFDIFINGNLANWAGVNWASYGAGNFPFTFRQRPGQQNALGKVKFMFPNPYNIYFHDTPAKSKFAETSRAFSHGCIRLSRPMDLAHELVDTIPGWSAQRVDEVVAGGQNTTVKLPVRIPVHLIYSTAFKGRYGIEFRPDVYGRDRKLAAALAGRPSS